MVNQLMSDLNKVTMIITGLDCQIWKYKDKSPVLFQAWKDLNLLNDYGLLTFEGQEMVLSKPLLEYEFNVACERIYNEDPKTDPMNYTLLRRGLGKYFDQHIQKTFIDVFKGSFKIGHSEELPARVLDLGCGSGQYSIAINNLHLPIQLTLVDKSDDHKHLPFNNFQADIAQPGVIYTNQYDYIIMSEIIHCMSENEITNVLDGINDCLTPKGRVIVTEQFPSHRMDWRMETYSEGGKMYTSGEIASFFEKIEMVEVGFAENSNQSHYLQTFSRRI